MTLPQAVLDKEAELDSVIPDIEVGQAQHFSEHERYMRLDNFKGDTDIFCHEYKGPAGAGYMVFAKAGGFIKCIDNGPEGRGFEWREIVNDY